MQFNFKAKRHVTIFFVIISGRNLATTVQVNKHMESNFTETKDLTRKQLAFLKVSP